MGRIAWPSMAHALRAARGCAVLALFGIPSFGYPCAERSHPARGRSRRAFDSIARCARKAIENHALRQ